MTREEAIEVYHGLINTKIREAFEFFAPELRKIEDERIRKEIIDIVTAYRSNCVYEGTHHFDECLAWLEKQKDSVSNAKYIEDVANAFVDGRKKGIEERQKEQPLRDFIDDFPYSDEQKEQKPVEWSEEDEEMVNIITTALGTSRTVSHDLYLRVMDWLRSPRPSWKPSEE